MEKTKVKILSGFRLTIPEHARRRLPISIGEELDFTIEGNRLVYKVTDLPDNPVFSMLGIARGQLQRLSKVEEAVISEVEDKFKRKSE